jgi:antitoxin (DNA-binding transcriptional repressor) of toxin-antitoxin stability system
MEKLNMKSLNVDEAKTKLSSVLTQIETRGEKFLICRNGKPVADLVPHAKKSRLKTDPLLRKVKISCDLTKPLTEEDWDV